MHKISILKIPNQSSDENLNKKKKKNREKRKIIIATNITITSSYKQATTTEDQEEESITIQATEYAEVEMLTGIITETEIETIQEGMYTALPFTIPNLHAHI